MKGSSSSLDFSPATLLRFAHDLGRFTPRSWRKAVCSGGEYEILRKVTESRRGRRGARQRGGCAVRRPPAADPFGATRRGRRQVVIEVLAQRDAHHLRGIALTPTQGLARGMVVQDTGGPLEAPVGKAILSRMFDVFGNAIDRVPPLTDVEWRSVHRAPPPLVRRSTKSEIFETGIKVIDVLVPLERGGKAGLFGGRGRGKDGPAHRDDPQHGRHSRRRQHLLRDRRALPRRRGALPRHEGSGCSATHGDGFRPDERAARRAVPRRTCRADDGRILPGRRASRRAAA